VTRLPAAVQQQHRPHRAAVPSRFPPVADHTKAAHSRVGHASPADLSLAHPCLLSEPAATAS
jgi:hypothetical protein